MRIVAFFGPSGSGKTRLLEALVPELKRRGLRVAVIKNSHHASFDREGSDSDRLCRAGAEAVAVRGPGGVALFRPARLGLDEIARLLPPVDLVLGEGFKSEDVPKIEVHRSSLGGALLGAEDPRLLAVVSDADPQVDRPWFRHSEIGQIADFLERAG